ncbi:DUF2188 domain-containing protein, partial [Rhizobium sp. L74/93]
NHHKKWAIIRASSSRKYIHGTILPTATGKSRCPIAINQQSEVVIHRPNGQIRDKDSYGRDPFPPRG